MSQIVSSQILYKLSFPKEILHTCFLKSCATILVLYFFRAWWAYMGGSITPRGALSEPVLLFTRLFYWCVYFTTREPMTCIRLWLPYLAFNRPGKLWSLAMSPLPFVFCLKHKLSLYGCKLLCHRYRVVIIAAHCFVNAHGKPSQSGPKKMTYFLNLKCNLKSENCLKMLMKYEFVILRSGDGQLWITNQKWAGFKMDVMENCRTHQISQNMGWSIKK